MSEKAAKKKTPAKKAASKKAAKPKKEEKQKEEEKKEEAVVEKVKLKPAPQPWVLARHAMSMRHRQAKGYSFGELESAEIGLGVARSLSIPIDIRRRSVLDENTEKLKDWYKPAHKPVRESKPKAEKAKPKKKKTTDK